MHYEMKIAGLTRQLPLCPINDELYIAAFVMFGDVAITEASAKELLGKDYVVFRKAAKLYMQNIIETSVDSITTDHVQTLCIGEKEASLIKGRRVLVVDDVISTGESLRSMEKLVDAAGGNIVCRMAVLAEGDAADRDDIKYLEKLPLFNADGSIKE